MTSLFNIESQMNNTMLLKEIAVDCKRSSLLNLNVVRQEENGETFRCLFGFYQEKIDDAVYSPEFCAKHFGLNSDEFSFLFGASCSSTISQRIMMIDAHIKQLEMMRDDLTVELLEVA